MLITTFLAAVAGFAPPAELNAGDMAQIFASACLDGEARLSPSNVTKVDFEALPSSVRGKLGRPASSQVWRLDGSSGGYLYVLGYQPARDVNPKICGVASEQMDLKAAGDMLDVRLAGSPLPQRPRSAQWMQPDDGYVVTATVSGAFKVVQVNWLSDDQRRTLRAELQSVSR